MPGPVSDSYDPEFGTGANCDDVKQATQDVVERIGKVLGPLLHNIVTVVQEEEVYGTKHQLELSEKELRVIRFGLNRAMEDM